MKTLLCKVKAPCYHPATGLDLAPGEMTVPDAIAATLLKTGLAREVDRVPLVEGVDSPTLERPARRRGRGRETTEGSADLVVGPKGDK